MNFKQVQTVRNNLILLVLSVIALIFVLFMSGCQAPGERLDVTDLDFAVTIAEIEIDVTSGVMVPGVPNAKFEGNGCTMIVRNAKLLGSADVVKLLTNIILTTGDCSMRGQVEGTGTVLKPRDPTL